MQYQQIKPAAGSKAEEKWQFLNQTHLPARSDTEQAGWLFGCSEEEVSILISEGNLVPLGKPAQNGKKMLATCVILELSVNVEWLNNATLTISNYWKKRNGRA
jgi:hypothetical protein